MATFKAEVFKHQKRSDGTYNVKIRITHNRQTRRMPTSIYVTKDDLTRTFKLKNPDIVNKTNKLIDEYRRLCNDLGFDIKNISVDDIIKKITDSGSNNKDIDFFRFSDDWIQENRDKKSIKNYMSAIQSLKNFINRDVLKMNEITYGLLTNYSNYLIQKKEKKDNELKNSGKRITSNRALSLYLGSLRHLHSEAKKKYNDEELGIIRIPWSPFTKFTVPKQEVSRKRALDTDIIKKIISLPYQYKSTGKLKESRYNLAKDVFILSFGLIGMNSIDLFNCEVISDKTIIYNRTKTKDRRGDKAEMRVIVQSEINDLFIRYSDSLNKRVFSFYRRYSDPSTFNTAINKGLKEIGEILKIDDLEFYAARHSWATIALNELNIDKYTVHSALNHLDDSMKVTDIYIKRDFTSINEANKKVLEYILKKE